MRFSLVLMGLVGLGALGCRSTDDKPVDTATLDDTQADTGVDTDNGEDTDTAEDTALDTGQAIDADGVAMSPAWIVTTPGPT
jgi:hypothetical protein